MLSHPAFVFAEVGSNAQRKALFAEDNISAVSRVDGNYCVIFRELADVALFRVNVALAVQAANPVIAVAKCIPYVLANTCHNAHVEHDIDRVGDFHTNFCER